MTRKNFDVIVIGGGPAGSTVATLIAMQGHKVLLLERERFPRHHIGESLLVSTIHGVCTLLDVRKDLEAANFVKKFGARFLWGKTHGLWDFRFPTDPPYSPQTAFSYQVDRARFDTILLNNARKKGVDVREGHRALEVLFEKGRCIGITFADDKGKIHSVQSSYVVDAAGSYSLLANVIGKRNYDPFFTNIAIYQYYLNGLRYGQGENRGNILTVSFRDGWFWYIPLSETLTSVGVVLDRKQATALLKRMTAEQVVTECLKRAPIVAKLLQPAKKVMDGMYGETRVARDYSYLNTRLWAPGSVLIGDAAGFIDPVFSSGVHLATYSALLAARSINTSLRGDIQEERCFLEFEQRYRREFAVWSEFLLSFYNVDQQVESYFWKARKLLNVERSAKDAFVLIVSGLATSGEPLFASTKDYLKWIRTQAKLMAEQDNLRLGRKVDPKRIASAYQKTQELASVLRREGTEIMGTVRQGGRKLPLIPGESLNIPKPVFKGGLVPSEDGYYWHNPAT